MPRLRRTTGEIQDSRALSAPLEGVGRSPDSDKETIDMRSLRGKPPTGLGLHEGRLATCPGRPNCVSSQAEDEAHRVAPLISGPAQTAAEVWQRLQQVLEEMDRVRIVTATDHYLHAECSSAFWGFVDDLECHLDAESGVIHLRSAARMGYSDFGQNRRRIETLRRRLVAVGG
jgi:uncharacterized protein (DUF1499 family)